MASLILRTRVARFKSDAGANPNACFDYLDDAVVEVANGKITQVESAQILAEQGYDLSRCEHLPNRLLMAGFIDAHVHAPQLDVMGAYGEQLLDWLDKYTFPAELKFAEPDYSAQQTARFLAQLHAHGTTTAMVYTTSFAHSTEHLFQQAAECNMRLLAGKVWMDRNAPTALLDTAESAFNDSRNLIDKWHGFQRLGYVLTPRFAGTSTPEQLRAARKLVAAYPDVWIQTHLSENQAEVEWTKTLFPEAKDYLHTYEQFDLVTEKTLFAHCIHLTPSETDRIAASGAGIAFCPSSNLFLGSGLMNYSSIKAHQIPVALCSDIGAGTSLSPFVTMGDAYKVCQLQNYPLTALEAFYLASLGAARTLHLGDKIGSVDAGFEADFILINSEGHPYIHQRIASCKSIEEELFVYMTCGDDRLIERTYIAGQPIYTQQ
ncbi:guanine deaminase [Teredinibacter turnerae]|uniref:guanine deaminase n=1 Tax=Teredinibacter turnerae TaxID=2426 RepID=UPI000374E39E|nr:guanine deaminase [Teredinibacter turnerae]